jgi:hypothetical protein
MTELEFVKWLMLALLSLGVWLMKRTLDKNENKVSELEHEIQTIKTEYLHKNDFKEFKIELRGMFEEIRQDLRGLKGNG